jgi:hypothetical protein
VNALSAIAATLALLVGYAVGRFQPARRVSDWAHWHRYGKRPTGLRYAAVWTVLSAENIGWLIAHPVQGVHAWKHRNDPPPPNSPPIEVRRVNRDSEEV